MTATTLSIIADSVNLFPETPGVYIMKNAQGVPLYIGKAINLKNRVRSYFADAHEDRPHIAVMLKKLDTVEWIATTTEAEALILEANLIRKHKPQFNIDLKDDKHYPYLKITIQEPFPRLLVVRKVENDNARYFGPYTDVRAMRSCINYARRIFKIRDCKRVLPAAKPQRPCVNYAIGRCCGACAQKINQTTYRESITLLIQFLMGYRKECLHVLEQQMETASNALQFEEAAHIRDQIKLLHDASRLQKVDLTTTDINCDVFGVYKGDRSLCLAVLHFREGLLLSMRRFLLDIQFWQFDAGAHDDVVLQFYNNSQQPIPPEICIPSNEGFDAGLIEQWFLQQYNKKIRVTLPQKGIKQQLVAMAEKNARLYLMQKNPVYGNEDTAELMTLLKLPRLPEVIEAFDISNIGSAFSVAGMVHFKNGLPDKSNFRRYKIKTVEGQNDFAMMMEVVLRRLTRLEKEKKSFADCLLIDGGPGQLHAAMNVVQKFNNPPMVISLAKKEELLYSPYCEEPIRLPPTHPVRKLVERIRDEVHRWAITYHRQLRGRQFTTTRLSSIPGIGSKKSLELLRAFGSVSGIRQASPEEIAKVKGFSILSAKKLLEDLAQM
jgi:excinuclease ABC subunit C